MVSDLSEGSLAGYPLESLMFGGAPAHSTLPERARKAFPQAVMYVLASQFCPISGSLSTEKTGAKATV